MKKTIAVCVLLFLVVSGTAFGGDKRVATGAWRGEGIELTVGAHGANVEFPCARAEINGPLTTDKKGRFEISGEWYPEHPGPVRDGISGQEASFSGLVRGKTMTMQVRLVKPNKLIGDFELELNGTARLKKCR